MRFNVRYNPNWQWENVICFRCGEPRSVKYFVDLYGYDGGLMRTMHACNRCAPMIMVLRGGDKHEFMKKKFNFPKGWGVIKDD